MANPIGTVFASTPTLLEPKQGAAQSNTMNSAFRFAIQGSGTAPAAPSFQFALPGANSNGSAAKNAAPSFSFSLPGTQNPASSFQTNPAQTNPPAYGFGAVQTPKPVFGAAPPPQITPKQGAAQSNTMNSAFKFAIQGSGTAPPKQKSSR